VAAELGLQPSVLRRWRGPADEARSGATVNRPTAAVLASADQLEIRRLREELERAQMERDILKNELGSGVRLWRQKLKVVCLAGGKRPTTFWWI